MKILGIDPGTNCTGIGIIDCDNRGNCSPVFFTKLTFKSKRLEEILPAFSKQLKTIVQQHNPDEAAIEDIFYSVNVKSTIKLAHLRGVAIAILGELAIPISSYSPLDVKKTIAGYGRADKEQVKYLVENILNIKLDNVALDISDSLAVAICHAQYLSFGKR
jgi:crossover junction endodeoxyribonuclease RuvC